MGTQQLNYAFEASVISNSQYRRFRDLPVCNELDNDETMRIFACMEQLNIAAGTTIYEANSTSNQTVYLITSGSAAVSKPENNIYSQLGEGDLFGLFTFLDDQRMHSATVKATSDLELLTLNRAYFNLITLEEPQLGNRMLRFMFHLLSNKALRSEHEYAAMHEFVPAEHY